MAGKSDIQALSASVTLIKDVALHWWSLPTIRLSHLPDALSLSTTCYIKDILEIYRNYLDYVAGNYSNLQAGTPRTCCVVSLSMLQMCSHALLGCNTEGVLDICLEACHVVAARCDRGRHRHQHLCRT